MTSNLEQVEETKEQVTEVGKKLNFDWFKKYSHIKKDQDYIDYVVEQVNKLKKEDLDSRIRKEIHKTTKKIQDFGRQIQNETNKLGDNIESDVNKIKKYIDPLNLIKKDVKKSVKEETVKVEKITKQKTKKTAQDMKELLNRIEKAIKVIKITDNKKLWKKVEDAQQKILDKIITAILGVLSEWVITLENAIESAYYIYYFLCTLPVIGDILPDIDNPTIPKPKSEYSFTNWALTEWSNPKIFTLRNVKDIKNMLSEARSNNKRVRVINYSHTFSPQYADDDQYLGYMIPKKFIGLNPQKYDELAVYNEELTKVYFEESDFMYVEIHVPDDENSNDGWGITVGGGSSNNMYTDLCKKRFLHKPRKLPFPSEIANVIQYYQGWVGTTANSCHGSGIETTNTSAYVEEMTLINWKGETVVYKGEQLKKVCAHFGLLGIVIEIKIKMLPEFYSLFYPTYDKYEKYFPEDENKPLTELDNIVSNWYYNEFFWAPRTDKILNNSWQQIYKKDLDNYNDLGPPETLLTDKLRAIQMFGTQIDQLISMIFQIPATGKYADTYVGCLDKFNS